MEKVLVPVGTKQSMTTLFSDLQTNEKTNLKRRFDQIIESYGVVCTLNSTDTAVTSTEFKVTQATSTTLNVAAGSALTSNFDFSIKR